SIFSSGPLFSDMWLSMIHFPSNIIKQTVTQAHDNGPNCLATQPFATGDHKVGSLESIWLYKGLLVLSGGDTNCSGGDRRWKNNFFDLLLC
ncbi:hypothetical protein ACJX0J_024217, partial [Zea mays]